MTFWLMVSNLLYPAVTPNRGPLLVNRQRAQMLGITLTPGMGIEEYIDKAGALKAVEDPKR